MSRARYKKRQDIFVLPDTVWCKYPSLDTVLYNTDMINAEFVYQTDPAFFVFMRRISPFFLLFQRKVAPAWSKGSCGSSFFT